MWERFQTFRKVVLVTLTFINFNILYQVFCEEDTSQVGIRATTYLRNLWKRRMDQKKMDELLELTDKELGSIKEYLQKLPAMEQAMTIMA